jgi:chlorite dismutase
VDPAWRALPREDRECGTQAFSDIVQAFSDRFQIRTYSLVGTRGDADFLLWQIGDKLEDIQQLASFINGTRMGAYLTMPHSYLAMTRPSVYVSRAAARAERMQLHPGDSKYLFVYPFVKTREWYQLPLEERQKMMDEHIRIGRKYPSVKLNTTYSFGLDDQEFVVSFETDEPADFLDLVVELREAKTSLYTLRDTPIFSCIAMGLRETLDSLTGVHEERSTQALENAWQRVADASAFPPGSSRVVYYRGDQVAIFNVGGELRAISNRCSHANGSLAEGVVEDGSVICPSHRSRFDLTTGQPLEGPAARPLRTYSVRLEQNGVLLGPSTG